MFRIKTRYFVIVLPNEAEFDALVERIRQSGKARFPIVPAIQIPKSYCQRYYPQLVKETTSVSTD
jgi:hypothetical protein